MQHVQFSSCGDMRQVWQYIYPVWTQSIQYNDQNTEYIHFILLAYAPKHLKDVCHIAHTHPTALLCNLHIDPKLLHIPVTKETAFLPCYCHMVPAKIHAPQIVYICLMCKYYMCITVEMSLGIYVTYELWHQLCDLKNCTQTIRYDNARYNINGNNAPQLHTLHLARWAISTKNEIPWNKFA